jgi:ABC-type sugar transport system ATPase subunit
VIEVDDFHNAFADHVAARGISFCVEPGELLAIIGPNGAGKSTTMRAMAGIIPASRGRLSIAGFDVEADSIATKSRLAFVPDDAPLFTDLTVEEHLHFYASIYQVGDAHAKALGLTTPSTRRRFNCSGCKAAAGRDALGEGSVSQGDWCFRRWHAFSPCCGWATRPSRFGFAKRLRRKRCVRCYCWGWRCMRSGISQKRLSSNLKARLTGLRLSATCWRRCRFFRVTWWHISSHR